MANEEERSKSVRGDEISLKELIMKIKEWWQYLSSKWITISIVTILGGILGFTYAYFKKPIYVAATTFVLDNNESGNGGLGQYAGLASIVGVDLGGNGGSIFQGDNIIELYKSRRMIQKTLLTGVKVDNKDMLLIDFFISINQLRKAWKEDELKTITFSENLNADNEKELRLQNSIIAGIVWDINKNYLKVSRIDKKLNIIKVEVKSHNEQFSKLFLDQIVKNVNDFYVQTKTKKSLDNLHILQHQTDSVSQILTKSIYTGIKISDATPNLNPTRQVLRAPALKSQMSAEANKLLLGELVRNLELAKLSLRKETPLIQVVDIPIYPLDVEKIGNLRSAIMGMIIFGGLIVLMLMLNIVWRGVLK